MIPGPLEVSCLGGVLSAGVLRKIEEGNEDFDDFGEEQTEPEAQNEAGIVATS